MGHPCSVLYSMLRNTLQLNRGLDEENMAYMMSSFSEVILKWSCFSEARVNVFSKWHANYLCAPIAKLAGLCSVSMQTESNNSKFQDTCPHEASSRKKISAYWKEGLISRVWFIPASFMLWFDALPSHYLQLISKTVVSRVYNDFGCW